MGKEHVGIDLHQRRSAIYGMDEVGERIGCVRINNDPVWFAEEASKACRQGNGSAERVVLLSPRPLGLSSRQSGSIVRLAKPCVQSRPSGAGHSRFVGSVGK